LIKRLREGTKSEPARNQAENLAPGTLSFTLSLDGESVKIDLTNIVAEIENDQLTVRSMSGWILVK
jgi:hypothetical protein